MKRKTRSSKVDDDKPKKSKKRTENKILPMEIQADIPMHLIESQIFSRLPTEELLSLKSVSKSWKNFLDSPDFANNYFGNNYGFILQMEESKTDGCRTGDQCYYSISCNKPDQLVSLQFPVKNFTDFTFVGSSNGVVCLTFSAGEEIRSLIYLWNPATGGAKLLLSDEVLSKDVVATGFVFIENDCKVVRVRRVNYEGFRNVKKEVEIYSLKENSWRRVGNAPRNIFQGISKAFVNGAFHWGISRSGCRHQCFSILSFDVCKEAFRVIKLPDGIGVPSKEVWTYGGKLSFIVKGPWKELDVWVMEEYGLESSWTKRLSVELPMEIKKTIAFCEKGEVVIESLDRKLSLCNLESGEITKIHVPGVPSLCDAVSYRQSLASLGPYKLI